VRDIQSKEAHALAAALEAIGVRADVEVRDRLAILLPVSGSDIAALTDDDTRRQAVALAKREGFTHLTLEIRPAARASLPRD
jgi:hypothetical protein